MTNRDRKIEETRKIWVQAVKRKQELIKEIWQIETIEEKTKQMLFRYGEQDFVGVVQETTDVAENHNCTCSCDSCSIRCRLGNILFGES